MTIDFSELIIDEIFITYSIFFKDLKDKYHNKFKYHISNCNPDNILDIFFQLYHDIHNITDKGVIKKKSPTLRESLANRKS